VTIFPLRKDEATENKDNQRYVIKSNQDLIEIEQKMGIDVVAEV